MSDALVWWSRPLSARRPTACRSSSDSCAHAVQADKRSASFTHATVAPTSLATGVRVAGYLWGPGRLTRTVRTSSRWRFHHVSPRPRHAVAVPGRGPVRGVACGARCADQRRRKPEQLRRALSGAWSRASPRSRLVHLIDGDDLVILQTRFHYE